jgi:PAS domain S-box-containing protein
LRTELTVSAFVNTRQYKWLPWLIIGMAVLTVTTVALGLHYIEGRLVAARGESLAFAASEIADKLDLLLAEQYDDTLELARTQVFRKGGIAAQSAYLATVKANHQIYLWLGVTDAGGRIVAATDPASVGQDRSRSDWFQAARDSDGVHMSAAEPFEETGGVDAIAFTAPIKGTDGKLQGTLTTRVGLPALEEVLTRSIQTFRRREEFAGSIEYQFMSDKGTAFIDSDLLHKGHANLKQLGVLSALLSESRQPGYVGELHKRRHVPVITGYAQTRGFDQSQNLKWTILLRMDQSDLLTPIRKVLWTLGAVSLLIGGPLFITLVWSTTRLKQEWTLAQEEHARATLAEVKYSALLESTGEGVCSMDGDGRLVFINSAGAVKLGYRPDELLGKRVHDILHHSHPDGSPYPFDQCPVTRTIRSGQSCVLENEVLWRKDGASFPAKYSAYPIQEEGEIKGAVVIFSDVTEKEVAQENLRKSERFLHQAQQIARLGSWLWDIPPNVVKWSHHLYQLFGLRPGTAVTFEVFLSIVHPEDQASVRSAVESSLRNDTPYDIEYRAVRPDGAIWWVHARGEVVRNSNGIPLLMVGVAQDITERRQAENQLRESEQRFRAILDGALDAVVGMDAQGVITDWNPRAEAIFGWSRSEAIGRHLAETIIPVQYREQHRRGLKHFLTTGEGSVLNRRIEITALRRDGTEFPVELTVSALKDGTGHRFTAFLADITERKTAEDSLRDNEMQMRLFMEATADSIWNWDLVTNHLVRSSGFEKLFGYAAEEIAPTIEWWVERLHPDDRERIWTAYQDTVTSGRTACSYEYRFRRRDGSYAVVIDRCYIVRDGIGKVVRAIGAMTDITERKQAEQALQESTTQLAAELSAMNQLHALGTRLLISSGLTSLLDEILNASIRLLKADFGNIQLYDPNTKNLRIVAQRGFKQDFLDYFECVRLGDQSACSQAMQRGERVVIEDIEADPSYAPHRAIAASAGYRAVQSTPLLSRSGELLGMLSTHFHQPHRPTERDMRVLDLYTRQVADLIERKQAEEALRESERRFRTIFDQAPIGMAVINSATGQFRRINKKYCEIAGYPHKELLTRTFHDITHPDDLQADLDNMTRMMEGRIHNFQMEKRYIRKDGAIVWVNLMCVSLGWDHETDRRFHIAMVKDITERKRAEEGLRQRSRQQAIEAELSLLAATVPDLSSLLNTVTKLASNALEVDYCEVLELLPNDMELQLRASAGWKDDRIGQVWTAETGSLAHAVLQSNKPVIRTLPDNTRFGGPPWLHKHGAVDVMHVRIHGKENPWGVLGVYAAGGRTFSRDDVNFFQTISSILATAIERMQAEDVLRSANQTLRTLSRQLLQVQEEDRRTIARDLHDEIGQSLTAIKLNVERAQRTSDRAARERIMKDCIQITDSVLNQVRNLSLDLHPSILDDLGLSYALKWYADRQAERAGLKVEVAADPSEPRLPQDVEIACFRIAQEALTNVVRHAQASRASITLKRLATRVELRIQDDGIGFDARTVQSSMDGGTNIGLTGMRERARLVGGEVHVKSAPQKGTEITAIVPLPSVPSANTTTP